MNNNDLICKYLLGGMDADSEREFAQELKNNPELHKEYEFQKEVAEAITEDDIMELRGELESIESSRRKGLKLHLTNIQKFTAAASITLFLGLGLLWLYIGQITNPQELYASYFQTYPNIHSQRSVNKDAQTERLERVAFQAYEEKNWTVAVSLFNELIDASPENTTYVFYGGIVNLKQEKPEQAISHFKEVLQEQDNLLASQANWYIALAYLKTGNINQVKYYLDKIITANMDRKEEAKELLQKLN